MPVRIWILTVVDPSAYWYVKSDTQALAEAARSWASLMTPKPTPPAAGEDCPYPRSYMEAASCWPAATLSKEPW